MAWQHGDTQEIKALMYASQLMDSSDKSDVIRGMAVAEELMQQCLHNESVYGYSSSYFTFTPQHPPPPTMRSSREQSSTSNNNARQMGDQSHDEALVHATQSTKLESDSLSGVSRDIPSVAEAMQHQQRMCSYGYNIMDMQLPDLSRRRFSSVPYEQNLMLSYANQTSAVRQPCSYGYDYPPVPTQQTPTQSVSLTPSENYTTHTPAMRKYSSSMIPAITDGVQTPSPHKLKEDMPLHQPSMDHATSLFIESDLKFLDPLHNFLRCECIELFVVSKDEMVYPGKGYRAPHVGQVGLRCLHCKDVPIEDLAVQAVCFPKKLATLFEGVRNYQRMHFEACTRIPNSMKVKYTKLLKQDVPRKPYHYVKVYYAEAASELGLTDTPNGLVFGSPPNRTGTPSEKLSRLIKDAEYPLSRESFRNLISSGVDKAIKMKKFEHVASDVTRRVIANARKEPTPFVWPQDFATAADIDFLLLHQLRPCRSTGAARLKQRGLIGECLKTLSGLCCKHCVPADLEELPVKGVYFPVDLSALTDSSFSKALVKHFLWCKCVPQEIKDALVDLKGLSAEYGVTTKRGSKQKFLKNVLTRMEQHYK